MNTPPDDFGTPTPTPWEQVLSERFDRHLRKVEKGFEDLDGRLDALEQSNHGERLAVIESRVIDMKSIIDKDSERIRSLQISFNRGTAIAGAIAGGVAIIGQLLMKWWG